MRLFIAEKPSLARAIAEALPGPQRRAGDSIECGPNDVVAWCAGHILETAPPDAYSPEYKSWRLEHLPIVPNEWKLEVSTAGLVKTIKGLLKSADRVVHAGDPDREGQLLVDEVLKYLRYRGPVDRVLINDLNPDAVRKALDRLESNEKYRPLYEAALARQRADWLFGLNLTRLYTILGRKAGYDGVLSVGRVQTPLLALIVQRDLAIENFQAVPYFELFATCAAQTGATLRAQWVPSQSVALDEEGRLLDRSIAEAVRAATEGHSGTVIDRSDERKNEPPPLPCSLADLQIDAAKRLGLSAANVLEAAQSLYEKHRLTTYPRSDCSYLPEGHFTDARAVIAAIEKNAPNLGSAVATADLSLRSRAWNDKKITAHHAIVPTASAGAVALSEVERSVYELIARRYLLQFYNVHEYEQGRLTIDISGHRFTAMERRVVADGWKAAFRVGTQGDEEERGKDEERREGMLPDLQQGDSVTATKVEVTDRKTQPPKPFTDATLMQAMCNAARYVKDPNVKKILTETDGIGTPATRASIIETLFVRGYVVRQKKVIVSTPTGRTLVRTLPEVATTPDRTAKWEAEMREISEARRSLDAFLDPVRVELEDLVEQGKRLGELQIGEAHLCPKAPSCAGRMRRIKGSKGFFWSCMTCRTTANDRDGRPARAENEKLSRSPTTKRAPSTRRTSREPGQ